MSHTEEQLHNMYSELLPLILQIQSQYTIAHGDFSKENLIKSKEQLEQTKLPVRIVFIRDGEDTMLKIYTKEGETVYSTCLNVYDYSHYLEEYR